MEIEKHVSVAATSAQVWNLLLDAQAMAGCVPGMQSVEVIGPTEYVGVIKVKISFISAKFRINTRIVEQRAPEYMRIEGTGEDTSVASSLKQQSEIFLTALPDGNTDLRIRVKVDVLGRLGTFGLSVMKTKADRMWDEFGQNLAARFGGKAPAMPAIADARADGAATSAAASIVSAAFTAAPVAASAALAAAAVPVASAALAASAPAASTASTSTPVTSAALAASASTASTAPASTPATSTTSLAASAAPAVSIAPTVSATPATPPAAPQFAPAPAPAVAAPNTASPEAPKTPTSPGFEASSAGVSRSGWWSRIFSDRAAGTDKRIHVELRRGDTFVKVDWPAEVAADCATWLRDVLR